MDVSTIEARKQVDMAAIPFIQSHKRSSINVNTVRSIIATFFVPPENFVVYGL
jgi:hypothetical protein